MAATLSETQMLNAALSKVGASRITGISDGSIAANACADHYVPLRQSLLRAHNWNFAERRASLTASVTAPLFQYAFSYPLPADWLKMKEYNGMNVDTTVIPYDGMITTYYKIEGKNILTNDGTVLIVYVADIDDPNQWDSLFYQVVTTWLASDLALAIPKDSKRAADLLKMATGLLLPLAAAVDGQDDPVRPIIVNDLIWGR